MPSTNLLNLKILSTASNVLMQLVIVTTTHVDAIEEIMANCPTLEHLILVGDEHGDKFAFQAIDRQNMIRLPHCAKTQAEVNANLFVKDGDWQNDSGGIIPCAHPFHHW